ncbi:AsmA-like C-terminal region-containing protein [Azonexus sp.]|uniref:AsmA-like C-terminal region-containing protein n=1 Tax=Azonexus sp. TaxID=1872668 RepID=UPI0035B278B2
MVMNVGQVYAKTPIGDEAVRQSTRVVQRNLRMVLVQVDGKLTVAELSEKIGNARLVENAIRELESGGYIVPLEGAAAAWERPVEAPRREQVSAISQFSTFGTSKSPSAKDMPSRASQFSTFGKPILPVSPPANEASMVAPSPDHREKPARNPIPLSRWLYGGLGIVFFVILLVLVYPYDRHREDIAKVASEVLKQPVSVGKVSLQWLPRPQLLLSGLEIGEGRVASVAIDQPWQLLFGDVRQIERLTANGAELPLAPLLTSPLLQQTGMPDLQRITLENLSVKASHGLLFSPLNGHLEFSQGSFVQAALENPERSLLLKVTPAPTGLALAMEGRAWPLPGLKGEFSAMQAKGILTTDRLQVSEIETNFLGGLLRGQWELAWSNGLVMTGSGRLERIDLALLSSSLLPITRLEGELSGELAVSGRGDSWTGLWQAASAQMKFKAVRGNLHGLDIGEAGRRGAGATVRAGTTRFDALEGNLQLVPGSIQLRDMRLEAGAISASGQVTAGRDGLIDGRLMMAAQTSAATIRVPLALSGRLPELTLTAGR